MRKTALLLISFIVLAACSMPDDGCRLSGAGAAMSPDYSGAEVPCNIAPLNFCLEDSADSYLTVVSGADGQEIRVKGQIVRFPGRAWKKLLAANAGKELMVRVFEKKDGAWVQMEPFGIDVSEDPVDAYAVYRLVDPTYGMYGEMSLVQRNLESFETRVIFNNMMDYGHEEGQCINCHSFQNYGTENMQFHVRQKDGGTVIVHDGRIRKVNLKADGLLSAGVYPSWHPTEDLIAYSLNLTKQFFFSRGSQKTEVLDSASDIILYDPETDEELIVSADPDRLETFPYWTPDGRTLYYCSASTEGIAMKDGFITDDYDKLRYDIVKRSFDPASRTFGEEETLFAAAAIDSSATFPRQNPSYPYLLFTMGHEGYFHIWHKDSDLYLMDLQTGEVRAAEEINSSDTESYHSWSSDGKWLMFSSRRDDGTFTRIYLAHFGADGRFGKAFVIPDKDPRTGARLFKSYNIPEFVREPVPYSAKRFLRVVRTQPEPARLKPNA